MPSFQHPGLHPAAAHPAAAPKLRKGRPQARHHYFVPVPTGLEPVLLAELQALGLEDCRQDAGGVHFEGNAAACYKANLWLRTGARVLRVLAEFPCADEATLYKQAYQVEWEHLMGVEQTLSVRVVLGRQPQGTTLTHSQFLSRRVKDAIVDRFRDVFHKRPNVNPQQPDLAVHAFLDQERCTLSLDSSGAPLFMRGYREGTGAAPLKETLAAGLIGLTGWHGEKPFHDFMCGTGTLPIEAALLAGNRAPGLLRERFGFQTWPDYRASDFRALVEEARQAAQPVGVAIHASDRDPRVVEAARENARRAGVGDAITFSVGDAADFQPFGRAPGSLDPEQGAESPAGPGLVLINPPYGERLGDVDALKPLYKLLGDLFKQRCKGMECYIFTTQSDLIKSIGLRASRRTILFNGPLECRLLRFEMY
jgi:putative N6-adenine-specific DNA methylase